MVRGIKMGYALT